MGTFTIPTIYTAVDRFSAPLRAMEKANASFGTRLDQTHAKSERLFRKLTPGLSDTGKQFAQMASSALAAASVIGGVSYSVKSISDYETAIAGFRTIVSDLTDKDFAKYKTSIAQVATSTKKSTIEVADSFGMIAGLNSKFAETSEGLSAVSMAAITLSKASKDELSVSASNLVGIMNQYSLGAMEANRTINVLAAGQAVGAASITQTAESFANFGSVASGANITLEQSVGLIETLGKFSVFGAEAGTKLRGSVLKLQQAGIGYTSGQFQIIDALEETRQKMEKLTTSKQKDAAILKIFGAENISTGKILLNNIDLFEDYTKRVTGTSEAQKAAEINSKTLSNRLTELKSAWINMLTGSEKVTQGLDKVKKIIVLLADNLDTIISVGIGVIGFFTAWKIANLALKTGIIASNAAATAFYIVDMVRYVATTQGMTFATAAWTIAQESINAAIAANPIGVAILAIGALAVGVYALSKAFGAATIQEKLNNEVTQRALENSVEQRAEASLLFLALRKAAIGSTEFANTLKRIDALQPGLIDKYNLQAGAIRNIAMAERELMATIIQRAKVEARSELLKEKTRALIQSQNNGPTLLEKLVGATGVTTAGGQQYSREKVMNDEINTLASQIYADSQPTDSGKSLMNPAEARSEATANAMTNNVTFNNPLPGSTVVVNGKTSTPNSGSLTPSVSSTMSAGR